MKTNYRNMNLFFWGMIILLLWSCSPTTSVTETATLQPTTTQQTSPTESVAIDSLHLTNTPTATKVGTTIGGLFIPTIDFTTLPTPGPSLESHDWQAETVLVEFSLGGNQGWTIATRAFRPPPALILFSSGQIVSTVAKDRQTNPDEYEYYTTILSRDESCQILNTLDQAGFLTFDGANFHTLSMGGTGNSIEVNAWQSRMIDYQGLFRFADCINDYNSSGFLGCGYITESTNWRAVVDTYNFLENYEPPRLEDYLPQEYIVWVNQPDYVPWEINQWPFALETSELSIAWQVDPPTGFYEQDGFILEVYSRPKMPHEVVSECTDWPQINYEQIVPANTMSCFPEDGVLQIPEIP